MVIFAVNCLLMLLTFFVFGWKAFFPRQETINLGRGFKLSPKKLPLGFSRMINLGWDQKAPYRVVNIGWRNSSCGKLFYQFARAFIHELFPSYTWIPKKLEEWRL